MEDHEQYHIRDNLRDLIKFTSCDTLFLAHLYSKQILDDYDMAELNAIKNEMKKSGKLYDIIVTRANSYGVLCEALEETLQTGAFAILKGLEQVPQVTKADLGKRTRKRLRFNVRSPVHLFTGREEELIKLHEEMTRNDGKATVITQTTAITGLGGIGKTELCRKYIEKYSDLYENIIWIGAEKQTEMVKNFRDLAKDHLRISIKDVDGQDKEIETVVEEVYKYFTDKKCIFVFDNAVSSEDGHLDKFLPSDATKKPNILITSRDREWEIPTNILFLEQLKTIEAIDFVKKGLGISDDSQDAEVTKLVTRLQFYPLALQQSISFIKQQSLVRKFGIEKYLESFELNSNSLLNSKISKALFNSYSQTTLTTWKITTDIIAADKEFGSVAMRILHFISYFEPDNIPEKLLQKLLNLQEDDLYSALRLLVKYSMVTSQQEENTISIHRLVQQVTRIGLQKSGEEEDVVGDCLRAFTINRVVSYEAVMQIRTVFEYHRKDHLDFPIREIVYHVPTWIVHWMLVCHENKHEKHLSTEEKCLQELLNQFSLEEIDVVKTEFQSALIKFSQGNKYEECLQDFWALLQKCLKQDEVMNNHDGLVCLKHYVGESLMGLGKFNESLEIYSKVYEDQKESYTPEKSAMVLKTLGQFATLFIKMHKYGEALQTCNQILLISSYLGDVEKQMLVNPTSFESWDAPLPPNNKFSGDNRQRAAELCQLILELTKIDISWEFIGSCLVEILTPSGILELESIFMRSKETPRNWTEAEIVACCENIISFSTERLKKIENVKHLEMLETLKTTFDKYCQVFGNCSDEDGDLKINYDVTMKSFDKDENHEQSLPVFYKRVQEHLKLNDTQKDNLLVDSLVKLQAHTSVVVAKIECYKNIGFLLSNLDKLTEKKLIKGDAPSTSFKKNMQQLKTDLLHCFLSIGQLYLHLRDAINCLENEKVWGDGMLSQNFTLI